MFYKKYLTTEVNDFSQKSTVLVNVETDKDDHDWENGSKLASYAFIQQRMSNIMGIVLTIMDASMPEGKQLKAIKDLIRNEFAGEYAELYELMTDKKTLEAVCYGGEKAVEVSLEEALGN